MALSLKAIRKRIVSVKNTQKITRAMKMVAAAKLRRAQARAVNGRHYTDAVWHLACRLASNTLEAGHPLMTPAPKTARRDYLVLTSDRGLCGGFNSNLLRRLGDALEKNREAEIASECRLIGKRGRDYFKAKGWEARETVTELYEKLDRGVAQEIAEVALRRFESGKTDEVYAVFNYFRSVMSQEAIILKILPLEAAPPSASSPDTIYEPDRETVLDKLLRESVIARVYSCFLESMASELAARMAAMDNATRNASDMIDYLTLQFNRARQATITRELMDIVGGAEALAS